MTKTEVRIQQEDPEQFMTIQEETIRLIADSLMHRKIAGLSI
jgi:hypothetical protein